MEPVFLHWVFEATYTMFFIWCWNRKVIPKISEADEVKMFFVLLSFQLDKMVSKHVLFEHIVTEN